LPGRTLRTGPSQKTLEPLKPRPRPNRVWIDVNQLPLLIERGSILLDVEPGHISRVRQFETVAQHPVLIQVIPRNLENDLELGHRIPSVDNRPNRDFDSIGLLVSLKGGGAGRLTRHLFENLHGISSIFRHFSTRMPNIKEV
jgi:hypothetical protein